MVTVKAFETQVWKLEGIRIVVRAQPSAKVPTYHYKKAAPKSWNVNELLDKRIYEKTGSDLHVAVVDGYGKIPHKGKTLDTVRATYLDL